ncbi:MAG: EAL domain-containing protein [Candidatus Accumulibacter sp.]|uniref:bifunctional diguanylate cyclase/phosphodiesterase n=1 Tax=Accumulibacter sp. TaxID=2053492 RepID=UPI00258E1FB2|nr:EAL domain-containing protein [Accumulibacter sp.]MCM8620253.1 EAL domain-containing protein [Accumulibacter sp.]
MHSRPARAVTVIVILANLFVCSLVGVSLHASYAQYHDRAAITSRNTNRLVAQTIEDEIRRIDFGLRVVADEYTRQSAVGRIDPATLTDFLRRQLERLPVSGGLRIADQEGEVVFSSDKVLPGGISITDRDYFVTLRDNPSHELAISRPLIGKISNQWVLIFARRLSAADGSFAGVVLAQVATEWFERKFSRLDVGPNGTVVFRGNASRDFDMLGRLPPAAPAGYMGQTKVSSQFRASITANPQEGTYEAFAGADNVRRVFSYQAVGDYPLITLVGLSTDDFLAEWWREFGKLAALAAAFAVLSILGATLIVRALRARAQAFDEVNSLNEVLAAQIAEKDLAWRERRAAEEQIDFIALHDSLTGLPNPQLAEERFRHAVAYAEREHSRVALIFVDLDDFKCINDSLGHRIGDGLICEVAQRLHGRIRETDTLCRRSGDEFIAVLGDLADADASAPVLVKLAESLQNPIPIGDHELNITASMGIAIYPEDGRDFETLLKKAENATYRAKEAGRNTYRFFDARMNVEVVEQLTLRNDLRQAAARNELVLHYQPLVDIRRGRLIGVEALIRWNHPGHGMLPPSKFIPLAEESGLIVPISEWVLREACCQAAAWAKDPMLADIVVAVNLSAVHFKRGNLEQSVIAALEESALPAERLELELTESMLISDSEAILHTIRQLKQIGVKLSIDDFGTGYSSLAYLKRFEVDKLKIDQTFVRDLPGDVEDAAIVRAIIQMAASLGLSTIAEGVETEAGFELLKEFGCDEAQGYWLARPMLAAQLPEFSRRFAGGNG